MLRGVRGATTLDSNQADEMMERVGELLRELLAVNDIDLDEIGAAIFSTTPDIDCAFPAAAARRLGWSEVPLFGTLEMETQNGLPRCVRVLLLWNTDKGQAEIRHVYLRGAAALRPDLGSKRLDRQDR